MVLLIGNRPVGRRRSVADQFEQRSVRIAEVDARAAALAARALDRAELDLDAVRAQALDRRFDRPVPHEAQVAVSRTHRIGSPRVRLAARAVDVQLLVAEAIGVPALVELDQLGAEDGAVEGVGILPVRDGNDDVVESHA
jgi:hypothetical protein